MVFSLPPEKKIRGTDWFFLTDESEKQNFSYPASKTFFYLLHAVELIKGGSARTVNFTVMPEATDFACLWK